jgi:hypothetical protein
MTNAVCRPLPPSVSLFERERGADRFVELLECLADLRVATARKEIEIIESIGDDPPPHMRATAQRLIKFERSPSALSADAASVHQALRPMELI